MPSAGRNAHAAGGEASAGRGGAVLGQRGGERDPGGSSGVGRGGLRAGWVGGDRPRAGQIRGLVAAARPPHGPRWATAGPPRDTRRLAPYLLPARWRPCGTGRKVVTPRGFETRRRTPGASRTGRVMSLIPRCWGRRGLPRVNRWPGFRAPREQTCSRGFVGDRGPFGVPAPPVRVRRKARRAYPDGGAHGCGSPGRSSGVTVAPSRGRRVSWSLATSPQSRRQSASPYCPGMSAGRPWTPQ